MCAAVFGQSFSSFFFFSSSESVTLNLIEIFLKNDENHLEKEKKVINIRVCAVVHWTIRALANTQVDTRKRAGKKEYKS